MVLYLTDHQPTILPLEIYCQEFQKHSRTLNACLRGNMVTSALWHPSTSWAMSIDLAREVAFGATHLPLPQKKTPSSESLAVPFIFIAN